MRLVALALLALITSGSNSLGAEVDWKMYGGLSAEPDGNEYCFYEERGVIRPQAHSVRVWTKCLLQKDLEAFPPDKPYYRAEIDMGASRAAHYYLPPLSTIERMKPDQIMQTSIYETVADLADYEPKARIFYELDCRQKRMRELSISVGNNHIEAPMPWKDVGPESNGANLLELLCR
jgi:hypothetical protein